MKKKICIIFSLFISCLFLVSPVYAKSTDLEKMVVNAYLNEDGSAHIEEIWDITVNEGTEIYKVFKNMGPSQLSNLKVKDEKGFKYTNIGEWDVDASRSEKNGKCGLVTKSDGYELCFGVGDYGKRKYTFEYDVSHFVQQYTNDQGFSYAFFSDMSLEPREAKIVISSPYQLTQNNASIWAFGYEGSVTFKEGKVVMEAKNGVPEGAKMQLLMRIDDKTFAQAYETGTDFDDVLSDAKQGSDYNDGDYTHGYDENGNYPSFIYGRHSFLETAFPIGLFIVAMSLFGIIGGNLAKKTKKTSIIFRDNIPLPDKKDINMFRDIPCHKDIFEFYYLAKKTGLIDDEKGGLIAAILLRWIQKGFIEFEKTEESHLLFLKKDGFSIDLDKDIPLDHSLELKLLGFIRNAAGSNKKLETKEFEKWCSQHYKAIDKWFEEAENIIDKEYRQKGLLTIETVHTKVMGMRFNKDVDMYDGSIREEMEHVIGLKKFLEEMSLIDEKEVIEVKLWEEYLIFASILGIADKVQEQLGRLCPTFNQYSELDTIYTMNMVHMFAYNSMRASAASQMQAQAARSGGFGGGSSFGGGGGFSGGGGGGVR